MNQQQCSATIYRSDGGGWPSPCRNKASVERNGRPYCKEHDPLAVAEKQVAKKTAYDANRKAAMELGCDKRAAQDLLVRKAAAFDQIMAIYKAGTRPTTWLFLDVLFQEFEEATHA